VVDGLSHHLQTLTELPDDYWWHNHRYNLVCDAMPSTVKSLLDFGSGSGGFLKHLSRCQSQFPNLSGLHGFDTNATSMQILQKSKSESGSSKITIHSQLPKTERFDALTMLDVLEHIEDDVGCLKSNRQLIHDKGQLILTVPAFSSFWSHWDEKLGHYRRYDKRQLTDFFKTRAIRCHS
jgi:2-polyprenyl-3-methyl-5-hydroxy-6-metoxy-1,4-benzoquinol methylase